MHLLKGESSAQIAHAARHRELVRLSLIRQRCVARTVPQWCMFHVHVHVQIRRRGWTTLARLPC